MNRVKSTDVETNLDNSFYSDISAMISTKKKKDKEPMKRKLLFIIIAISSIGLIVFIYTLVLISRLKSDKLQLASTIEQMKIKLDDMSSQHALLSDKLSRTQEDYMTLSQKIDQQTAYYTQMEKENEKRIAELLNKESDTQKATENLSTENGKLKENRIELQEIIKNMALKVEEYARNGDQSTFSKIKRTLKKIKKKVIQLLS